jgi:hypothetical protein
VEVRIQFQGPSKVPARPDLVSETVEGIPKGGNSLGAARMNRYELREHISSIREEAFPIEGSTHGQHEVQILIEPHGLNLPKERQSPLPFPKPQEGFPHPNQSVFMERVQTQRLVEGSPGPGELFPGQSGIAEAHIKLDGVRVERKALSKHLEGPFEIPVVIQPVRLLVVFL